MHSAATKRRQTRDCTSVELTKLSQRADVRLRLRHQPGKRLSALAQFGHTLMRFYACIWRGSRPYLCKLLSWQKASNSQRSALFAAQTEMLERNAERLISVGGDCGIFRIRVIVLIMAAVIAARRRHNARCVPERIIPAQASLFTSDYHVINVLL